jgi:hypothetical protein
MSQTAEDRDLERHRDYLMILARTQIPHHLRHRIDPAGLVEETLRQARRPPRDGTTEAEAEPLRRLRDILIGRLAGELGRPEGAGAGGSVSRGLGDPSTRPGSTLGPDRPVPGPRIPVDDLAALLSGRRPLLTEDQAEAVHLRHCEGWSIERIGRHMGRTPVAVGGLLRHGLEKLADYLTREPASS